MIMYLVICGNCYAQGPKCELAKDAIDCWNKRRGYNESK